MKSIAEYWLTTAGRVAVDITKPGGNRMLLERKRSARHLLRLQLVDSDYLPLLEARRIGRFPRLHFSLGDNNTVRSVNLLRTRWVLTISGRDIQLPTPMITTRFTDVTQMITIRASRQNAWYVGLAQEIDSSEWIGAIALVFLARWESW